MHLSIPSGMGGGLRLGVDLMKVAKEPCCSGHLDVFGLKKPASLGALPTSLPFQWSPASTTSRPSPSAKVQLSQ